MISNTFYPTKYPPIEVGQQFGQWTIIGKIFSKRDNSGKPVKFCVARCSCGRIGTPRLSQLVNGGSKNCIYCVNKKHGYCYIPLWANWKALLARCLNPNHKRYKDYGARGISVCKEWKVYETFRDWALENGYRHGLIIDRIDNDGDYNPNNCRFVTYEQSNRNKRKSRLFSFFGETKTVKEWTKDSRCKQRYQNIVKRLNKGWLPEKAIFGLPQVNQFG